MFEFVDVLGCEKSPVSARDKRSSKIHEGAPEISSAPPMPLPFACPPSLCSCILLARFSLAESKDYSQFQAMNVCMILISCYFRELFSSKKSD